MLIAYLDEFGHQGPFISHDHEKYNTHPCFGYAGYVLPAENVRKLGSHFKYVKEQLLAWEIEQSDIPPDQWEKKGSQLLTTKNISNYGNEINPSLSRIFRKLGDLDGRIFFFGQQKRTGPVSVTKETSQERENHCLIQAISRLGRYASETGEELMVIMDATDTRNRERAVATLGATIYSREHKDTNSIIEIPLQTESHLYGTIQLADWTCALLARLTDYHFAQEREFSWSVDLGRDLFRRAAPTNNSIIWTNAASKDSKCFPKELVDATPFREKDRRRRSRKDIKRKRNQAMVQRLISAGSDEFRAKLERIKKDQPRGSIS